MTCTMPQEIRWPQYKTGKSIYEVENMLALYFRLQYPSIQSSLISQIIAVQTYWPEMNQLDGEMFIDGMVMLDSIFMQPKKELN